MPDAFSCSRMPSMAGVGDPESLFLCSLIPFPLRADPPIGGVISHAVKGMQYVAIASGVATGYWQPPGGAVTMPVFSLPKRPRARIRGVCGSF